MNTFQSSLFYKLLFLATQHIFSKPMIFLISFMGFLFSDHSRILQILSSLYTNSKVCIIHIERFKVSIYVKKIIFIFWISPDISQSNIQAFCLVSKTLWYRALALSLFWFPWHIDHYIVSSCRLGYFSFSYLATCFTLSNLWPVLLSSTVRLNSYGTSLGILPKGHNLRCVICLFLAL